MPRVRIRVRRQPGQPQAAPAAPPQIPPDETGGPGRSGVGTLIAGGLTGLLALSPRARTVAKTGLGGLSALRKQLMLSGFALPKSVLGGIGATAERAIETGSTKPIRELFKTQTLRDIGTAYKTGGYVAPTPGTASRIPSPGKLMGSVDEAMQKVLIRAGASPEEARSALLQAPLPRRVAEALENPVAQHIQPFRRTPINQFLEGFSKVGEAIRPRGAQAPLPGLSPAKRTRLALALYGGTGAAHGAATADTDVPVSIPLGVAASARYGLPYGLAAMLGRAAAGGRIPGSGIAPSLLPMSEFGVESALSPEANLRLIDQPPALRALRRILYGE